MKMLTFTATYPHNNADILSKDGGFTGTHIRISGSKPFVSSQHHRFCLKNTANDQSVLFFPLSHNCVWVQRIVGGVDGERVELSGAQRVRRWYRCGAREPRPAAAG